MFGEFITLIHNAPMWKHILSPLSQPSCVFAANNVLYVVEINEHSWQYQPSGKKQISC